MVMERTERTWRKVARSEIKSQDKRARKQYAPLVHCRHREATSSTTFLVESEKSIGQESVHEI
jgi:hypothetical protein